MAKKQKSNHAGVKVGVGIAAVAALAAGAYFLYGKDGAKNRKKIKGWMLKAKGEMLEGIEKLKEVSEPKYHEIVEKVAAKYAKLKNVDAEDIDTLKKEIKAQWKNIKKHLK